MMMMLKRTRDKVTGCLLGAAVGDALAFPFEGLSPVFTGSLGREAVQAFRAHRSGCFPEGQVSAYTQLMMTVAEALRECAGEGLAEAVGRFLFPPARDRLLVEPSAGLLASLEGWARGKSAGPRERAEPPLHLLPLACNEYVHDEDLFRDLSDAARCTGHEGAETLGAGAAFLAAVRYSMSVGEIVLGDMLDAARGGALRFSRKVATAVHQIPDVIFLAERDGACPLKEHAPTTAVFQVLSGLMSFLKSPYDCERSLLIALKGGGGCAAAFVCGALAGAFNGEAKLPAALARAVVSGEELRHRGEQLSEEHVHGAGREGQA